MIPRVRLSIVSHPPGGIRRSRAVPMRSDSGTLTPNSGIRLPSRVPQSPRSMHTAGRAVPGGDRVHGDRGVSMRTAAAHLLMVLVVKLVAAPGAATAAQDRTGEVFLVQGVVGTTWDFSVDGEVVGEGVEAKEIARRPRARPGQPRGVGHRRRRHDGRGDGRASGPAQSLDVVLHLPVDARAGRADQLRQRPGAGARRQHPALDRAHGGGGTGRHQGRRRGAVLRRRQRRGADGGRARRHLPGGRRPGGHRRPARAGPGGPAGHGR